MATYVIVFEADTSFISKSISKVLKSPYSHAAILINGVLFDASEKRGSVGKDHTLSRTYRGRTIVVYQVQDSSKFMEGWAQGQVGRSYDYLGVLGWFLRLGSIKKVYCFEWVLEYLHSSMGFFSNRYPKHITAEYIIKRIPSKSVYKGVAESFDG